MRRAVLWLLVALTAVTLVLLGGDEALEALPVALVMAALSVLVIVSWKLFAILKKTEKLLKEF